jgi:predicted unusual protein kinase regulating ubiquinone biosynthesis (AarF/ABC1/UbiB family)
VREIPTSVVDRPVRLVAGLARAGTRWLTRTARRGGDVEAERAVASSLGELKGLTMKVGQLLGYADVGLPRTLMTALSTLHSQAQALPFERVRAVLESELGADGLLLARGMHPEALAAGSLGQVHRSTLPDGTVVAVKVLYPGIADTVARDLAPATLGSRLAKWIRPRSPLATWVGEVRRHVLDECDYALAARRQALFAERFADHPAIVVPAVHGAWCSSRVLTTTLAGGLHLEEWLATAPSPEVRARAAGALFDFYLGSLIGHGLYLSDPHPGNYLLQPDGRVAFVDFGSARELSPEWEKLAPMFPDEVRPFEVLPFKQLMGEPLLWRMLHGLSSVLARLDARDNWYRRLHPPEVPAEPVEIVHYDVLLISAGDSPIAVVRTIRDLTDLALRDIRDLIDAPGGVILHAVPEAKAERLRQRLEQAGARVTLRRT